MCITLCKIYGLLVIIGPVMWLDKSFGVPEFSGIIDIATITPLVPCKVPEILILSEGINEMTLSSMTSE